MSAFIVENDTINRITTLICRNRVDGRHRHTKEKISKLLDISTDDNDFEDKVGCALLKMNVEAVADRYAHNQEALDAFDVNRAIEYYEFKQDWYATDIQVFKSLRCYLYQCSEGDVPDKPLYKVMEQLKNTIATDIVSTLPQYEKAVWA